MAFTVPSPRLPLDGTVQWYETGLGWATAMGPPLQLLTGSRFDVLELPADAGLALLRRVPRTGPVALAGRRMQLLVAAGGADELPGLLDWLEWGGLALDLTAIGAHGRIDAPAPPGPGGSQGATCWLRPPEPGREVEPDLPVFSGVGQHGGAPDLVRLVDAAATECHRARMVRMAAAFRGAPPGRQRNQPLAFS
ncbi:SCO3374 family protein [Streptomyces sp. NPDC051320]|uniref:SCO3374 family protein n=1 Tax=Streptomyces sp. NPDC051320 TaxID=3154644 RepID=UPI0034241128